MTVTRRSFLRSAATTVLLTGIALDSIPLSFAQDARKSDPSQDFPVPLAAKQESIFYFKRETFEPYLNGQFTLRAGANTVSATLVSVRDCTPSANANKVTRKSRQSNCFAIIFSAEGKLTDLTTIYDVEHGALGKFALFLSRRDGPHGTYFYEAVFNQAL